MKGLPVKGLDVSGIESDGGITIKGASGVVLSIVDRGEHISVESYTYETTKEVLVDQVPPEFLRNPRATVHIFRAVTPK